MSEIAVTTENQTLAMIERASSDPQVDMDKFERLMDMQERVLDRDAKMSFSRAMSAAQSEMGRVSADADNKQTRSRYVTYGKMDAVLRPVYTRNGFALSFNTGDQVIEQHIRVQCEVSHIDGHTQQYQIDMPADGKGAKGGDVMTKTHAAGAAMSYGMRYLLKMIFNVAIGEDDADGNQPVVPVSADQVANLEALVSEVNADLPKFLNYLKVGKLQQLNALYYDKAVKALESKRVKK